MSKDKYPSILTCQMEAIVIIILQISFVTYAVFQIGENSVNKPLQVAGMCATAERLSEKWTFGREAKLQADIHVQASHKRVYLFYNPPINFHKAHKLLVKSHCWCDGQCTQLMIASTFIWFQQTVQNEILFSLYVK